MIAELGHFALILALLLALLQASVPLAGAARRNLAWMSLARSTALAQFVLVTTAFAALMHAYVTSDFSVQNVFENSHSAKPLLYKITGVWSRSGPFPRPALPSVLGHTDPSVICPNRHWPSRVRR